MAARTSSPTLDGLLLLDKPAGPTSHDLVARVRRALGIRRVGHAGTLDPFATGLLVCCVGRATRLVRFLTACEKTYSGVVRFGLATETGDSTGRPLARHAGARPTAELSPDRLGEAVAALTGELDQVPPMYSAKKQQGRRLHELARAGLEVERAPVRVRVGAWRLGRLEQERLPFEVCVSAGTYVRVLAEDLGRLLGCPAHLDSLRRLASGALRVEQALHLGPGRDEGPSPEEARAALIPMASVPLSLAEACVVSTEALGRILHGRSLAAGEWEGTAPEGLEVSLRDSVGDLVGIGLVGPEGELRPVAILRDPD